VTAIDSGISAVDGDEVGGGGCRSHIGNATMSESNLLEDDVRQFVW